MRELLHQGPLSELISHETAPGPDVESDESILREALNGGSPGYHSLGTCAMGPNDDSAVDPSLRVRGVEALRVVDASVFPVMISGNCNGPTMALAWRASDLILDDAG
jgi:choline dehydrogenase-like flavoprotein